MKELKALLTEIANQLETVATNLGAMEAALTEHAVISSNDIDKHTGLLSGPHINAKHGLANARYLISKLPD